MAQGRAGLGPLLFAALSTFRAHLLGAHSSPIWAPHAYDHIFFRKKLIQGLVPSKNTVMKGTMPVPTSLGPARLAQNIRLPTIKSRRVPKHVFVTFNTSAGTIDASSGPSTVPTRRLSSEEAIEALYSSQHPTQRSHYASFYSSELGGIITDPALMVVQLDDHMVHRGHAVFETVALVNGFLYELDRHVDRFLSSSSRANITFPPRLSRPQLIRVLLETVAASKLTDGGCCLGLLFISFVPMFKN